MPATGRIPNALQNHAIELAYPAHCCGVACISGTKEQRRCVAPASGAFVEFACFRSHSGAPSDTAISKCPKECTAGHKLLHRFRCRRTAASWMSCTLEFLVVSETRQRWNVFACTHSIPATHYGCYKSFHGHFRISSLDRSASRHLVMYCYRFFALIQLHKIFMRLSSSAVSILTAFRTHSISRRNAFMPCSS